MIPIECFTGLKTNAEDFDWSSASFISFDSFLLEASMLTASLEYAKIILVSHFEHYIIV